MIEDSVNSNRLTWVARHPPKSRACVNYLTDACRKEAVWPFPVSKRQYVGSKLMRLLIADGHEIARTGLRLLLERRGWKVVAEAPDGGVAIRSATELQPDVAILEYELPLANGATAAREIRARSPGTEVLIFTLHENDRVLGEIIAAGARGYLLKSDSKEALYMAVQSVACHQPFFTLSISERMLRSYLSIKRADHDPLTPKERHTVQLIAEGKTN
jgi:DNA-binding NarL/FixJ family response regulator